MKDFFSDVILSTCFPLAGEVGNASKMNLVVQLMAGVTLAGLAEGMALADRAGLQQKDVLEIMELTSLACPLIIDKTKGTLFTHTKKKKVNSWANQFCSSSFYICTTIFCSLIFQTLFPFTLLSSLIIVLVFLSHLVSPYSLYF